MEVKKKPSKILIRLIALLLVFAMIVTTVVYQGISSNSIDPYTPSDLEAEEEQVLMDPQTLIANMQALERTRAAQKQLSDTYDACMEALENEDYEAAVEPMEELLAYLKEDKTFGPYLRAALAELYYYTGRYAQCAMACDNICSKGEDSDGTYTFLKGVACLQTGAYEEGLRALQDVPEESRDGLFYYLQGVARLALEDYAGAAEAFSGAIDAGYTDIACYYNLGVAAFVSADYETAVPALQEVVTRDEDPSYSESAAELLAILEEAGE